MLARAAQVVVLADADKFGHRLTYRVGRLEGLQVVTDGLPPDWLELLAGWGCVVQVVA